MVQDAWAARRAAQVIAAVTGLAVLLFSVALNAIGERDREVKAQDDRLGVTLSQQVDAVAGYFEQARMADLLVARNPAFTDFYRTPGTTRQKIAVGGALTRRVNDALASLEQVFPGRVGEACFVNADGAEIARVVNGMAATSAQLSKDESANAFFAPTLALEPGRVYQAKKYVSEDTHDEVVSNSTVVTAAGHRGLVHFEIALASFRMPQTVSGTTATIVDADSGQILVDSRAADTDHALAGLVAVRSSGGVTTIGSRRVAYRRLTATATNANSWYLTVSAPAVTAGRSRGFGVGPLLLVLVALLTILAAAASGWNQWRRSRYAALHDNLTGLANSALLSQHVAAALHGGHPAAVLAIDLELWTTTENSPCRKLLTCLASTGCGFPPRPRTRPRNGATPQSPTGRRARPSPPSGGSSGSG
ncbi:hypothetical protein GCM10010172_02130 [Paractinoplanes ferrugineus]|uniref:Cache domain-containing protein n=1 Tax=Paractinoplanes ferrugineus TaxID=113564 RepID=A0A919J553_9ACTN|nr:hypothetical protein Afe05nite_59000 [Actinoplanes ferrugineus]